MRTFQLQTRLWPPQPRQQIFAFFSNPNNLKKITPPWLRFEITSLNSHPSVEAHGSTIGCAFGASRFVGRAKSLRGNPPDAPLIDKPEVPTASGSMRTLFPNTKEEQSPAIGWSMRYRRQAGEKLLVWPDLARIFQYRHESCKIFIEPGRIATLNREHPESRPLKRKNC